MKVLVADAITEAALAHLKAQAGWEIIESNPREFIGHLADAEAVVVRGGVKITRDLMQQAPKLRLIGRAGVGVDNVDLEAATELGILVMNTPGGNSVAVAEHALALMLSLARAVPQANASMHAGRWEKKKFVGNELRGKTLGVLGLGSIGREVVLRARAFEMRIMACDPYVPAQRASDLHVELADLATVLASSDYLSLHLALTPETEGLLSREIFARMKPGVRIINCARGELIDTAALAEAIAEGRVAGAALDVFPQEPPPAGDPLLKLDNVIATPHIGGSTEEAQETVGLRIVEQVVEYLRSGVAVNAVNMPALSPEQYRALGPWASLAERLGSFAAHIATGHPHLVRFSYLGRIAGENTHLIRNAGLAGVLNRSLSQKANLVNSMQIASQRGLKIDERHDERASHTDSVRLELVTNIGTTSVEGALLLGKPRLIEVEGIRCEAPLSGNITFMKNKDVPGVIGHVGTVMGRNRINIANFSLGRWDGAPRPDEPLAAVAVVETDEEVAEPVLSELRAHPAVMFARTVRLS
ncbi:MAG: phosphoglycerate dehydrogenase [Bryobacteraceae bacterium]